MNKRKVLAILFCMVFILSLCSCDSSDTGDTNANATKSKAISEYGQSVFLESAFHEEEAETQGNVSVDTSDAENGYIAIKATSKEKLKVLITLFELDETYTYDLPGDGTPTIYPLNMGDGEYDIQVMENIADEKYSELWSTSIEVALSSESAPFLRPNQMVNYTKDSACITLAAQLAESCTTDTELTAAVYEYLCEHVTYDYEKAKTVQSGYLPVPDETLSTGTGICFDYAALAASMLRSQGIPCRLITGYVSPDNVYHAWNDVYIESQGWVTVEIKASADTWKHIDITYAASGVDASQTDDNALYTTRYVY